LVYNGFTNRLFFHKDSIGFYSTLLTSKLLQPLENCYNNNLTVLVNGLSFSATTLVSANLQSVNRGIFVGVETGGGYNKCTGGTILKMDLPNTQLRLNLPLKVCQITNSHTLQGRGVFPKYPVVETIQDVLTKKDMVMEKAKELSSSK
jgi:C-terminal processing protease CtpA/Prc